MLICEDGDTVYESRFINEWVELKHPEPALTPSDTDGIILTKRFEILADGVCDACVLMFWEKARPEPARSAEWTARQMRKCEGGLREIERLLGGARYCVNDRFGMADIAVGSMLGWLNVRFPELPWRERHPSLAALQDRLEARTSFQGSVALRPDHPRQGGLTGEPGPRAGHRPSGDVRGCGRTPAVRSGHRARKARAPASAYRNRPVPGRGRSRRRAP